MLDAANAALEIDPASVKGLFRRGQAFLAFNQLPRAKADLMAAARADPKSKEIRGVLDQVKQRLQDEKDKEKAAFGGKLLA